MKDLIDRAIEAIVKAENEALRNAMQEALDAHNIEGNIEELAREQKLTIHEYRNAGVNQLLFEGHPIMEFFLTYPNATTVQCNGMKGRQLSYRIL